MLQDYLPQVRQIAAQLRRRLPHHVEMDDLVSAGTLGLLQATQRFDAGRQVAFGAYATHRIRGAMIDSLRETDSVPRDLRKSERAMEEAARQASNRLGRRADENEIALQLNIDLGDLHALQARLHKLELISLDAPVQFGETSVCVADQLGSEEPSPFEHCARKEAKTMLMDALHELPRRDRLILELYYFEELTMKEIGTILGIDESRVSQIHSTVIKQLRIHVGRSPCKAV